MPLDLKSIPSCKDYEFNSGYFDKAHGAFIRKYEYGNSEKIKAYILQK